MKKILYFSVLLAFSAACSQKAGSPDDTPEQDSVVVSVTEETVQKFQSEEEVRAYLCAHQFKSDEGDVIRFTKQAQEIDFNDMPVAVSTQIEEFNDSMAIVKGSGALGESTIRFTFKPTGNVLEDMNDGVLYWEQK